MAFSLAVFRPLNSGGEFGREGETTCGHMEEPSFSFSGKLNELANTVPKILTFSSILDGISTLKDSLYEYMNGINVSMPWYVFNLNSYIEHTWFNPVLSLNNS